MQRIYQRLLKEGNDDHKYLSFPDLRDKNFDILHSAIALNEVDLACAETVKAKATVNDSNFIN